MFIYNFIFTKLTDETLTDATKYKLPAHINFKTIRLEYLLILSFFCFNKLRHTIDIDLINFNFFIFSN